MSNSPAAVQLYLAENTKGNTFKVLQSSKGVRRIIPFSRRNSKETIGK